MGPSTCQRMVLTVSGTPSTPSVWADRLHIVIAAYSRNGDYTLAAGALIYPMVALVIAATAGVLIAWSAAAVVVLVSALVVTAAGFVLVGVAAVAVAHPNPDRPAFTATAPQGAAREVREVLHVQR